MVLPPRHLASKNRFSLSEFDLVLKSGNLRGSIAALVLHDELHGPTGNAFLAVVEDDGEDHRSGNISDVSGGGVGGGGDFRHTYPRSMLSLGMG